MGMAAFDLTRRLTAEALGTALLVAAVIGSGIMAAKLSGGNNAIALLCNTLATSAILVVIITIFAPISGAHFNPAVTLVTRIRGEVGRRTALAYMLVQIIGGCLGALFAHLMFGLDPLQISQTARTGLGQWFGEFVATFGLIVTILGCVRFRPDAVALAVGLYITSAYWFTSSTSFANPAVTIARSLSDTFAGISPPDVPAFIVAQILGALAAAGLCRWLFRVAGDYRASGTGVDRRLGDHHRHAGDLGRNSAAQGNRS
jgi:glycerol uptake facilitator-like aquaporin